MMDDAYLGPTPELMAMLTKAMQAPPTPGETDAEIDARRDRLTGVRNFADLSHEDQDWVNARIREVENGLSHTWQNPNDWGGDWGAEDAELDQDDLEPVVSVPDIDDEGWVGV